MVALEQMTDAAVVLAALLYPLLPPLAAHGMLTVLGAFNHVVYTTKATLVIGGQPYLRKPLLCMVLNACLTDIGLHGVVSRSSFRNLQPEDVRNHASFLIGMSLIGWWPYLALSLSYFCGDGPLMELDCTLGDYLIWFSVFCSVSFALSIPTYFRIFTRPLSIVLSRLAARRVRWLFRFRQEDIEANAEPIGDVSLKCASESEWVDKCEETMQKGVGRRKKATRV